MIGSFFNILVGLVLDIHTYVGIVIGAALGWAGLKRFYESAESSVTSIYHKI